MKILKTLIIALMSFASIYVQASNKVLVVLSAEDKITLKDGVVHSTGYFLSELVVPVKGLIDAGYEPVFATPMGKKPTMDKISDSAYWFGGDEQKLIDMKNLLANLESFSYPLNLSDVASQNLDQYLAILIPGGHAPMEDLLVNKDLGNILRYFHLTQKPTALICHGPIALLSTIDNSIEYTDSLDKGDIMSPTDWIYKGYKMTVFSTEEEKQEEPGQDNLLGGFVKFYPDFALSMAGGRVSKAAKWHSFVVRDRELITAQNPMSDVDFTNELISELNKQK